MILKAGKFSHDCKAGRAELLFNSAAFNPEEKNRRVIPQGGTTVRYQLFVWIMRAPGQAAQVRLRL
jgi:hypothetical protein